MVNIFLRFRITFEFNINDCHGYSASWGLILKYEINF